MRGALLWIAIIALGSVIVWRALQIPPDGSGWEECRKRFPHIAADECYLVMP
jgi:hypothetical protein